ncbi:MAG: hypothetical protein RIB80_04870 [Rhodospirillales bacterium]
MKDTVEWVVSSLGELGVNVNGTYYFLYKGRSIIYGDPTHEDTGKPMQVRPVFKREFGECCHPINYDDPTRVGTVSLSDSDEWIPLSPSTHPDAV